MYMYTCVITNSYVQFKKRNQPAKIAYYNSIYLGNARGAALTDDDQLEEKRGQFLGSTLKSTGDTFLVNNKLIIKFVCVQHSYIVNLLN